MPVAARKLLGLRTHQMGEQAYDPNQFYSIGDVVSDGGLQWRARLDVAREHRPQGTGDGSTPDKQRLVDECDQGWAAGTTGGFAGTTYTVTSTADTDTAGTLRFGAKQGAKWIIFDKAVFPLIGGGTITCGSPIQMGPNTTIDGRGASVRISKYPLQFRTDPSSPLVTNRGLTTANILIAYVDFIDFPNGTSVLQFGGANPTRRGGADLVYLHHITVNDIEDQNMSNGAHDNHVSRSTIDWSRFGPSPGPIMMSLTKHGGLKLFQVDTGDKTTDTITTLDGTGNPTNHDLINVDVFDDDGNLIPGQRGAFSINMYRRSDLTAHPFPTGIGLVAGQEYSVRHVGQAGQAQQDFTADNTTKILTATAHGYSNDNPVVLIGSSLPSGLRNGYIYYVTNATANTFKISISQGGPAKGFTTNGSAPMKVQKADLTKFQISVAAGQTGWAALDLNGTGTGWYMETTEPVYYDNGKGPQWGSHHPDDIPDTFQTYTADASTDTITTLYPHLIADGQRVRFWAQAGGTPGGITEGTTYYTRDTTSTTFKLSTTLGGSVLNLTSAAAAEQSFTAAAGVITATGHGLSVGDMVTVYGGSIPTQMSAGIVYWVVATVTANTFAVASRKGDVPMAITTGSGTLVKTPPMVQLIIGPNHASITKCDYRNMKLRSPKLQVGWYHLWNNRVFKWGDPDRGDDVGGFGNEMADHAQSLIEGSIYRPYSSSGTEVHSWSAFTNPREDVPTRGRSIYGINIDAGSRGAVDARDWTGGTSVILRNNLFEDGATTRSASSSSDTTITNDPRLDWFDPAAGVPVPYAYELIDVTVDPFILDTMLDRGAGNVQPWELV